MRLLMLARSAMLSTRAPSYPLSVNSFTAATRIAALVDSGSRVFPVRICFSRGRSGTLSELASIFVLPVRRTFGPLAGGLDIVIIFGPKLRKTFKRAGPAALRTKLHVSSYAAGEFHCPDPRPLERIFQSCGRRKTGQSTCPPQS